MSMKNMNWDEKVWSSLKDAIFDVPVFVRKRALKKVIDTSEAKAKSRGSDVVEAIDLIEAVKEKVPQTMQNVCFETLAQHGFNVEE